MRTPRRQLLIWALIGLIPAGTFAAGFEPAVTATNHFGIELYRQLAVQQPGKNLLLSPYSIQSALAMTYAGADGDTRWEMATVLHFPADYTTLQTSFAALKRALDRIAGSDGPDAIELHVANGLFVQQGYAFRDSFLKLVKDGYGTPLQQFDFKNTPEQARETINQWVEDRTRNKIHDSIPEGGVTSHSRLILVNALYLKPAWALAFDQGLTEDRPFKVGGSKSKKVPTMMQQNQFGYKKQKDFTAITIPYLGQNLQFLILLPDKNTGIDMLTAKITPQILRDCAALEDRKIVLFLPKFRIEPAALPLSAMLQTLGMKSAFDQPQGSANFSRMAPRQPNDYLAISEIFHKTFISLDEKGTEAAATSDSLVLTALSVGYSEPPKEPLEIHVDHPFLFAIQERESGVCLFLGCVNDPR